MFFSRLDSVGQLLSAHETHVTSTHYSHNSAPPTSRSDGFLWTTTSSCCCEARSSSSNSSSTYVLLQHPVLLQYTLLQHPLSSKDNTSTSSDILAAASQAKAAAVPIPGSTSTHMKVDVAANFGLKMSPSRPTSRSCTRRSRPRDEPGQERHAACVAEMARSVVCTPITVPRL